MKVSLINPPSPYLANDAAYPPSGLMYLAAALEQQGHAVEIIDLTGGVDWQKKVLDLEADIFGITCVTPNFKIVQNIAQALPHDRPVILGGAHPTFLPEDTLNNIRCNAIVKGESEIIIRQIMCDLDAGNLKKIYEGGLVPVEAIPKPSRHLVNLHRYHPAGEATTPVYSSRGCPFDCFFCSKVTGRTYRAFPIARVMEEIRDVVGLGFKHVVFGDDDIAIHGARLKELLLALKPFKINFRLNQDASTVDKDVILAALDSGCTEISYGIESGSPKMLKLMNKKASVEDNKRAIEITRQLGIKAKAYFLVNFPGETEQTVEETLRFAEEARPDKWLLSAFAPLPGSPTFARHEKFGITWMSPNWEDYYIVGKDGTFRPCFKTDYLSFEKQIHLHDTLYNGLKNILG